MAIVSRSNHKVRTSEKFVSSDFRIEASPEAFRILSDGLYSNKVKAVIRELSTNAVDSLIDAESNGGYEVHLPTKMEAKFSIRDYGTGLSHEDVIGLYTTYFGSNKTHSNAFTGQLGLGSKSPFAYTDSFTVTSWYGGMKRSYNAHISESGYPAISLLHEEECSTHSGLEIKFPVKQEDVYSFEEEAQELYSYFSVLPSFTGKKIEIEEQEVTLSGTGWHLSKSRYRSDNAIAVMGNIAYPIGSVDSDDSGHGNLLDTGIVLHFDIGDLDITPSRESLSMTKRTIENLKSRLDSVISEVKDEVQGKFDGCKDLWEARCLSAELFGAWDSPLYHLGNVCKSADIQFGGESIQIDVKVGFSEMDGISLWKFGEYNTWRSNGGSIRRESTNDLPCDNDATFFVDDLSGSGAYARCKEWVAENSNTECYLVRFWGSGQVKNDEGVRDKFLEYTGMGESLLLPVSELPKPTRSMSRGSSGTGVRKDKVLLFDKSGQASTNSEYWDSCEVDFDAGGIYVEISRYKLTSTSFDIETPCGLMQLIKSFDIISEEDIKVYGVKSANVGKYNKSDEWMTLDEYISGYIDINMETEFKHLMQKKANSQELHELDFKYDPFIKLYEHLESDTELKTMCKVLSDMKKSADREDLGDLNIVINIANLKYEGDIVSISNKEHLEKKYEESLAKYPIIKLSFAKNGESWRHDWAFDSYSDEHWKIVAEYVEQSL